MNTPKTEFSSKEEINQSLSLLKQTARIREDVEAWFKEHVNDLGMPSSNNQNYSQTSVALDYSLFDIVKYYEGQWADLDIEIQSVASVTVEDSDIHNPDLDSALRSYGSIVSNHRVEVTFPLKMSEWPFLTAQLLTSKLNNYFNNYDDTQNGYVSKILEHYVPKHFPGLTYSLFLSLQDNGLLPVDEDGEIDDTAIRSMLFKNASPISNINLPNSLSLE